MSDERETLEMDVLFVGAGPASLAGAYHLARLAKESGMELAIGVLEKGKEITSHALSGAVVDPRALRELFPDDWRSAPYRGRNRAREAPLPDRKEVVLPAHPAAARKRGQLRGLARQAPQVDGPQGRGRRSGHLLRVPRRPRPGGERPGGRRAHRRQGRSPARGTGRRTTSPAWTSAPRSPCSARVPGARWSSSSTPSSASGRGRTRRSTPSASRRSGTCRRAGSSRARSSTPWAGPSTSTPSAAASSTACRTTSSSWAWSWGSTTGTPCSTRTPSSSG